MSVRKWLWITLIVGGLGSFPLASPAEEEPPLFGGRLVPPPNERIHTQTERQIKVRTAVPSAEETREIFGADLYRENVQPVWVEVENLGDTLLILTPMGLDPNYYTPRETAHRYRKDESQALRSEEFESKGIVRLRVPPYSTQSGYIYSRVDEGTKSFNVDVVGDSVHYTMAFFVPVPGLKIDHHEVDFKALYDDEEVRDVDLPTLIHELQAMPCCVTDQKGENFGDPLNLVIVGDPRSLYYTFLRAGWDETETIYGASLLRTAASALSGGSYRYSPVSALYVFGRPQDIALQRARDSIHERNHLRLWVMPLRLDDKPVWIGQISRDIGVHFTWKTITTHKIDPDVDETREYLVEDLAYTESLSKIGYVDGVGPASYGQPRGNLTGDPYFTDGKRVIMWIADNPTDISEIEPLNLELLGGASRPNN